MIKWLVFKLSTLITFIFYPKVASSYRFFIRYFFIGKVFQLNYFYRDFILKKPYKKIEYFGEFSPELKFVIPYAYWHFKNGTLKATASTKNTKELYFFSENHIEVEQNRAWNDFKYDTTIPNSEDHNLRYNYDKWLPVPYKKFFQSGYFEFEKPLLIIGNKYNIEWGEEPINFLDNRTILLIYKFLNEKYQIIYNRPVGDLITHDESEIKLHDDFLFIGKNCPEIIDANKLYHQKRHYFNNFNHFQLSLYASCDKFVSVHGGGATLASYFGGVNIIYSVKGHELFFNEFKTFYSKLSGASIFHVQTYEEIFTILKKHYL